VRAFQLPMFGDQRRCFICGAPYVSVVANLQGMPRDMFTKTLETTRYIQWQVGLCSSPCVDEFLERVSNASQEKRASAAWE
jgi:hypothetical protein